MGRHSNRSGRIWAASALAGALALGTPIRAAEEVLQLPDEAPLPAPKPSAGRLTPPDAGRPPVSGRLTPPEAQRPPSSGRLVPPEPKNPPVSGRLTPPEAQHPPSSGRLIPPEAKDPPVSGRLTPPEAQRPPSSGRLIPPEPKVPPSSGRLTPPEAQHPPSSGRLVPPEPKDPPASGRLIPPEPDAASAAGAVVPPGEMACRDRLRALGVGFETQPPVWDGESCTIPYPLLVTRLGAGVDFAPAGLMTCPLAEAAATFAQVAKNEAQDLLGKELSALSQASTYVCRPRRRSGRMSEHATGNALDIAGFRFADGSAITVGPMLEPRSAAFLAAVRRAACGTFTTVLGPGSDADHAAHLHLDLAPRRSGPFCQ